MLKNHKKIHNNRNRKKMHREWWCPEKSRVLILAPFFAIANHMCYQRWSGLFKIQKPLNRWLFTHERWWLRQHEQATLSRWYIPPARYYAIAPCLMNIFIRGNWAWLSMKCHGFMGHCLCRKSRTRHTTHLTYTNASFVQNKTLINEFTQLFCDSKFYL